MDETRDWAAPAMRVLARAVPVTGVAAPGVVLLTVSTGAVASPTYDWPTEPFSVLGAPGAPTADLFGTGLMLGGLLALPFAAGLWRTRSRPVGGLYALVGLSFAGAGRFPIGSTWHEVFGVGILLGIPVLLWTAAVDDWRTGSRRDAALAFASGAAALAVWLPYDFGVEEAQLGYGFAELVAFLALTVWSVRSAIRLRERHASPTGDRHPEGSGGGEASR